MGSLSAPSRDSSLQQRKLADVADKGPLQPVRSLKSGSDARSLSIIQSSLSPVFTNNAGLGVRFAHGDEGAGASWPEWVAMLPWSLHDQTTFTDTRAHAPTSLETLCAGGCPQEIMGRPPRWPRLFPAL